MCINNKWTLIEQQKIVFDLNWNSKECEECYIFRFTKENKK